MSKRGLKVAEKLIEENLSNKSALLDLGFCELDGTEDYLFEQLQDATHIQELILSNKWFQYLLDKKIGRQVSSSNSVINGGYNKIKVFPKFLPPNLEKLILSSEFNKIKWTDSTFPKLYKLKHINLYRNIIEKLIIPKEVSQLEHIEVDNCSLKDFQLNNILVNMRILEISGNYLSNLEFLKFMPNLEILHIAASELKKIHHVEKFNKIEFIFLSKNHLKNFTFTRNLKKLKQISLSKNAITNLILKRELESLKILEVDENKLESVIFENGNYQLEEINFSKNKLKELALPSCLKQLKTLNLSDNYIKRLYIPDELCNIEILNLNNNNIEELRLPKKMPYLKVLALSSNRLESISFLGEMDNLESLSLSYNRLTEFTVNRRYPKLTTLGLRSNRFKHLIIPKELNNIIRLYLSSCLLEFLNISSRLQQLHIIDLDNNRLEDLSPLKRLHKLRILKLYKNKITDIEQLYNVLHHPHLNTLRLSFNQIKYFPFEITKQKFDKVKSYLIENNFKDISFFTNESNLNLAKILIGKDVSNVDRTLSKNVSSIGNKRNFWNFNFDFKFLKIYKLFLNPNGIYFIIDDGNTTNLVDYWIKYIKQFKDAIIARLILVTEPVEKEIDTNDYSNNTILSYSINNDEKNISERFEEIISILSENFASHAINAKIPKKWFNVIERLLQFRDRSVKTIALSFYDSICDENNLEDFEKKVPYSILGRLRTNIV